MLYNNAIEYFGDDFVNRFEEVMENCEKNDCFLFIHGAESKENANDICQNGLNAEYPELNYTAELINKNDKLLYEKLKSWPHWNRKFLVMCSVPKASGKNGVPIWNKSEYGYTLLPDFLLGYIDVTEKRIFFNRSFSFNHDYENLIEDASYLPGTGKRLEISIPGDEIDMYDDPFFKS